MSFAPPFENGYFIVGADTPGATPFMYDDTGNPRAYRIPMGPDGEPVVPPTALERIEQKLDLILDLLNSP